MSIKSLSFKERMDQLRSAHNRHSFHRRLGIYVPEIKAVQSTYKGWSECNYYLIKQKSR